MKQIDVLRALPGPTRPPCRLTCGEVLYQELVVLTALGLAEGRGARGETEHVFTGRLTDGGEDKLRELERRERGDG